MWEVWAAYLTLWACAAFGLKPLWEWIEKRFGEKR